MTIAEIIELESARKEPEQWNIVHFVREGNGFYRAHDWSAWLLKAFPFNDAIANMGVTAKRLKDGYIDAFVGFPATSLTKYIPNAQTAGFTPIDDSHFTVTVELPVEIGDVSYENLNRIKEEWKANLKVTDKKQQREERELQDKAPKITRISDVLSYIVSIPMEDISPREAYDILKDLRRKVSAMF